MTVKQVNSLAAILPMSSGKSIHPGDMIQIATTPSSGAIQIARVVVLEPKHWIFHRAVARIGPHSRKIHHDLIPISSNAHIHAADLIARIDKIENPVPITPVGYQVVWEVTNASQHDAHFFAAAVGANPHARIPSTSPRARFTCQGSSRSAVTPGGATSLRIPFKRPSLIESIAVDDAFNWIIDEIRIDSCPWTIQEGDFPATALSAAQDLSLAIGSASNELQMIARYIGDDPSPDPLQCLVTASPLGDKN
jgi:hypothetical protein